MLQKASAERRKRQRSQSPMNKNMSHHSSVSNLNTSKEILPRSPSIPRRNSATSMTSVKSEASFKSGSRYSTPPRSKNINISISSDSVRPDNRRKIKEGIENHLKMSSNSFDQRINEEWEEKLGIIINEKLIEAETVLENQAENILNKASKELYVKLKENTLDNLDNLLKNNEKKRVSQSYSRETGSILKSNSVGNLKPQANIIQTYSIIEQKFSEFENKLKRMTSSIITKEINSKILTSRQVISAELQENLSEIEKSLKNHLTYVAEENLVEMGCENSSPENFKTKKFDESTFGAEDPKRKTVGFAEGYTNDKESLGKNAENVYEMIETITKSYEQYKHPNEKISFSNQFTIPEHKPKDQSPTKQLVKSSQNQHHNTQKRNVPTTSVSSALQDFIKFGQNYNP